jgi:hypothetical protein
VLITEAWTKARMNRVMNMQDESSELRRRFLQDNTSGGELLVLDRQRGYIFYTMRGGVNNGYDRREGSGYDY